MTDLNPRLFGRSPVKTGQKRVDAEISTCPIAQQHFSLMQDRIFVEHAVVIQRPDIAATMPRDRPTKRACTRTKTHVLHAWQALSGHVRQPNVFDKRYWNVSQNDREFGGFVIFQVNSDCQ